VITVPTVITTIPIQDFMALLREGQS